MVIKIIHSPEEVMDSAEMEQAIRDVAVTLNLYPDIYCEEEPPEIPPIRFE